MNTWWHLRAHQSGGRICGKRIITILLDIHYTLCYYWKIITKQQQMQPKQPANSAVVFNQNLGRRILYFLSLSLSLSHSCLLIFISIYYFPFVNKLTENLLTSASATEQILLQSNWAMNASLFEHLINLCIILLLPSYVTMLRFVLSYYIFY